MARLEIIAKAIIYTKKKGRFCGLKCNYLEDFGCYCSLFEEHLEILEDNNAFEAIRCLDCYHSKEIENGQE